MREYQFSSFCLIYWNIFFHLLNLGVNSCQHCCVKIMMSLLGALIIGVCRTPMWSTMPVFRNRQFVHSELHWITIIVDMTSWCCDVTWRRCLQTWKKTSHRNSVFADTSNLWLTVYFTFIYYFFISVSDKLGNEQEDQVAVMCDLESIITFYCKSRNVKYETVSINVLFR